MLILVFPEDKPLTTQGLSVVPDGALAGFIYTTIRCCLVVQRLILVHNYQGVPHWAKFNGSFPLVLFDPGTW